MKPKMKSKVVKLHKTNTEEIIELLESQKDSFKDIFAICVDKNDEYHFFISGGNVAEHLGNLELAKLEILRESGWLDFY